MKLGYGWTKNSVRVRVRAGGLGVRNKVRVWDRLMSTGKEG